MNLLNYLFLWGGEVLIGLAFVALLWNILFLLRAETADGEIVEGEVVETEGGDSDVNGATGDIHRAIVQFTTPQGEKVRFVDSSLQVGIFSAMIDLFNEIVLKRDSNSVKIIYDPRDPKRARVKDFQYFYFWPMVFLLFGIVVCLASFLPYTILQQFFEG